MNDSGVAPKNQPQIDSRANLFFLLQTLSREMHSKGHEALSESSLLNHQIEARISQNGSVL
jgi:hypothetical protein